MLDPFVGGTSVSTKGVALLSELATSVLSLLTE